MQNTFKVGDKVRQKDEAVVKASDGSCLYKSQELVGKVLTVIEVEGKEYLHFDRIKENIPHRVYCRERFELVEEANEQHNYKVGDKVKVVKLKSSGTPLSYHGFIDQTFVINAVSCSKHGVSCKPPPGSIYANLFFYNEEIELVKDEPTPQEVVPTPKKNIAWAVVNDFDNSIRTIKLTRREARQIKKNLQMIAYVKVKKIEFNFA